VTRTVLTRGVAREATEAAEGIMRLSGSGPRGGSGLFASGRNQALLKCDSLH